MNTTVIPDLYYAYNHHLPFVWEDVWRMDGNRNYTIFLLKDGQRFISTRSLCVYTPHLPPYMMRVHKRTVVNHNQIDTYDEPTKTLILLDNSTIQVARRRWSEVVKEVQNKNNHPL